MSDKAEFIEVNLRVVPIYGLTGVSYSYELGDNAYGEWVIFDNEVPRYYLNIFDSLYKTIRDRFKGWSALKNRLPEISPSLTLGSRKFGLRMESRSKLVTFTLEKLPLNLIDDLI